MPDLAENIRDLEPLDFGSFMSPAGTSEGRVAPPEVDAAPDLRGASVASTRLGCELRRCGEGGKLLNPSIPKAQERENFHRKYFAGQILTFCKNVCRS